MLYVGGKEGGTRESPDGRSLCGRTQSRASRTRTETLSRSSELSVEEGAGRGSETYARGTGVGLRHEGETRTGVESGTRRTSKQFWPHSDFTKEWSRCMVRGQDGS